MKDPVPAYLRERTLFDQWPLRAASTDAIDLAVAIPCLAEDESLFRSLDGLAANPATELEHTLVICAVNNRAAPHASEADMESNRATLDRLEAMVSQPSGVRLAYVDASSPGHELPRKDGVGLARKLGLDWGLRILRENSAVPGVLASLDADTLVRPDYLGTLRSAFAIPEAWAAIIDYAHPMDGPEAPAIISYELFLRYHELGMAHAGSPYAFTAVGSTIACTAQAYAAVSGMNRRQAAEDFYFLQQLAKTGPVRKLTETAVHPSARPSHRVPFGTGRSVRRFTEEPEKAYRVYHPGSYAVLERWLALARRGRDMDAAALLTAARAIEPELAHYLEQCRIETVWDRLRANSPKQTPFFHHCCIWFDGLRSLRLLHHLRDHGYPQQDLFEAIAQLLTWMGKPLPKELHCAGAGALDAQGKLLECLRALCRESTEGGLAR